MRYGQLVERGTERMNQAASLDRGQNAHVSNGEHHRPYEEWTKNELYERAQEVGVEGRSTMNKRQLLRALRKQY
jgi:hypothetical protein